MNSQVVKAQTVVEFGAALEERVSEIPAPVGKQVVVRIISCGLCHTDLHLHEGHFDLGRGNQLPLAAIGIAPPFVMGHEPYGEIVDFGPESGLSPSDKGRPVIVFPWIGCGDCGLCNAGLDHQCAQPQAIGMQATGGHADHLLIRDPKFLIDAAGVDKLLAGSYACAGLTSYSAIKKLGDLQDKWIAIIGMGGVGTMGLAIAKAIGFKKVVAIDISDERLKIASEQFGADLTVNSSSPDAVVRLQEATGGLAGVVDFVGSGDTSALAVSQLGTNGKLVNVGLFGGELQVPLPILSVKQLSIRGSYVGSLSEMSELMEYVRAGKVKALRAESVPISSVNQAMEQLRAGKVEGRLVLLHS